MGSNGAAHEKLPYMATSRGPERPVCQGGGYVVAVRQPCRPRRPDLRLRLRLGRTRQWPVTLAAPGDGEEAEMFPN